MLVTPAIDIQDGVCVRLLRGAFSDVTHYGDPETQIARFARAGASWVHVVDLDGARRGVRVQTELIGRLAAAASIKIQCGGGVRSDADIRSLIEAGAERVVMGSIAVRTPTEVMRWSAEFGVERICVALDVRATARGWDVAADGWRESSGKTLEAALAAFPPGAVRHVLVTDISCDGALAGPNVELIKTIAGLRPDLSIQASGGVSSISDLVALRQTGASAAIVGRALYERRFTLEDALAL